MVSAITLSMSNTTDATNRADTSYFSGAPEHMFFPEIRVVQSYVFCAYSAL